MHASCSCKQRGICIYLICGDMHPKCYNSEVRGCYTIMWKFYSNATRRIRETFERSVNHFEKHSPSTGISNPSGNGPEDNNKRSGPPCRWFSSQRRWDSYKTDNNTNHESLNRKWFGAKSWDEKFERGADYFEKRRKNGSEDNNKWSGPPCRWFSSKRCWDFYKINTNTNHERFNFECLNRNWFDAITWSGALVIGWYTSQLIHLKLKYHIRENKKQLKSFNNILTTLHPYVHHVIKSPEQLSSSNIEHIIHNLKPNIQLISNDNSSEDKPDKPQNNNASSASSTDEFQDTLNYIENKLGWAAIQNGQLNDGLNLLRSAANRNHAPALYNLGLCYEMGIGLDINENKAMELYRSAACLEHPDALYNLGIYYAQGRGGLAKDKNTATRLLKLAAVQGHQIAKDTLNYLEEDEAQTEQETESNTWSYQCSPFEQTSVGPPTLSSVFVENVNFLPSHKYTEVVV